MPSVLATIRVEDLPIGKALAAEHRAVTDYLAGRLLLLDVAEQHRLYSDLIDAHDKVADMIAAVRNEEETPA